MPALTYDYKPKLWIMLLVVAFFGACALIIGNVALTNDRGLSINRIFNLSQGSATAVYWALALVSVGFVVAGVLGLVKSIGKPKQIVLDDTTLHAPKSAISATVISIPYTEIVGVSDQVIQKQVFLAVTGRNAKVTIAQSALSSKDQFAEMREALIARVTAAQS